MGLNPRFAPRISGYQDTDTRTMRKPIEEEVMRISASGSGIVFEEEKGKDMNERLGPFDRCDEPVVVDQSPFEKQWRSAEVGPVLAKARQAYADRTQSQDKAQDATIGGGACGDQVTFGHALTPRKDYQVDQFHKKLQETGVFDTNLLNETLGLPRLGSIYPAPQEKQVDPMWDMYFSMAFKSLMLAWGEKATDIPGMVETAGEYADKMVAEREKRKK